MLKLAVYLKLDLILDKFHQFFFEVKLKRYEMESGQKINFVKQGAYNLSLLGDLRKFKINKTSHLKSDTTIECSGGVEIGRYFHAGKGLTIFSANHNWREATKIPYDERIIEKAVIIEDFVWVGSNVTILPGVIIHEGAIVAAGSVVVKNVLKGHIVGGNPAKEIGQRDIQRFEDLKKQKLFH